MAKLTGKVALVTGGSSGIGLATARRFVEEGATVIITGRQHKRLEEAASAIGGAIEAFQADIFKLSDLERLRAHLESRHGRVDVIFANAGGGALGAFGTVTEADFDRTVSTNLKGTFAPCKHCFRSCPTEAR